MLKTQIKKPLLTVIITLLLIECIGAILIFPIDYAGGAYPNGLFRYIDGNIPIFHVTAEFIMAIVTFGGLIGWLKEKPWGKSVTLLGLGMFSYSAINSMGWAIHNNMVLAVPMLLTIVLTVAALPFLLKREKAGS